MARPLGQSIFEMARLTVSVGEYGDWYEEGKTMKC